MPKWSPFVKGTAQAAHEKQRTWKTRSRARITNSDARIAAWQRAHLFMLPNILRTERKRSMLHCNAHAVSFFYTVHMTCRSRCRIARYLGAFRVLSRFWSLHSEWVLEEAAQAPTSVALQGSRCGCRSRDAKSTECRLHIRCCTYKSNAPHPCRRISRPINRRKEVVRTKINPIVTAQRYPVWTHSARLTTIVPRYSSVSEHPLNGVRLKRERAASDDRQRERDEEKEGGHIRRLISRRPERRIRYGGRARALAEEQKGRKGRRNIPMHRAPWHRYCISGTLQSPLPGPVDYLPDNHAAATYLTTYLVLRLPNILPPRAPLLKNLDRDVADLITPIPEPVLPKRVHAWSFTT